MDGIKTPGTHCNGEKQISFLLLLFIYLLLYVAFNSQVHIVTGSLPVEEASAYCVVNNQASASNYQLSNMKHQPDI